MIRRVILRMVHTRGVPSEAGTERRSGATAGPDGQRGSLAAAAARVKGLETLIVGWRGDRASTSGRAPLVVVTVWLDADAMLAALARDELAFLRDRLGLDVAIDHAESYEVMSRTFGSLPLPTSVLRILQLRTVPGAGTTLFERLRELQRWLTDHGLIASHVARRVTDDGVDALVVGVWLDHDAIALATRGRPDQPAFADEIEPLVEHAEVATYDALEIAPRLPMASGPPIVVIDESRRVVDLTPAAAAALGRTQDEAIGALVEDLAAPGAQDAAQAWRRHLHAPEVSGESPWAVPSGGQVMIRWRLRRDAPVKGRHTMVVRRRNEPEPTADELNAALSEAFPREIAPDSSVA